MKYKYTMLFYISFWFLMLDTTFTISNVPHGLSDSIFKAVFSKIRDDMNIGPENNFNKLPKDYQNKLYGIDYDETSIPMIRDQEYLQHSSLWGHQYMSGGTGEGHQHLKPDGSILNINTIKTDAKLPSYCDPPNPCPLGYTVEDGCLDNFINTAEFSKDYQSKQDCLCDTEHMYDCGKNNQPDSFDVFHSVRKGNSNFDKLISSIKEFDDPYINDAYLPVSAKKGNQM